MAIYPKLIATVQSHTETEAVVDVEAWTEQATQALQAVALSPPPAETPRGTSVTLAIPLDGQTSRTAARASGGTEGDASLRRDSSGYRRKEPIRRDSLKRREALLKGKEGSRQRRRWENGRSSILILGDLSGAIDANCAR